jgi:hypothetical protein
MSESSDASLPLCRAGVVPVMYEPSTGVPVCILQATLLRTCHGSTFTLLDVVSGADYEAPCDVAARAFTKRAPHVRLQCAAVKPGNAEGLGDALHNKTYAAKVKLGDGMVVYFVKAAWTPGVDVPPMDNCTFAAVHNFVDVHGRGRCFRVETAEGKDDTRTVSGLFFVPAEQCRLACMTLPHLMRAPVVHATVATPPFLPPGTFVACTPALKEAIDALARFVA